MNVTLETETAAAEPEDLLVLDDLTGHDRCDSCGSQAFVRVEMNSGLELVFCGHHYAKNEAALGASALRVRDERSRINEKPSVSV